MSFSAFLTTFNTWLVDTYMYKYQKDFGKLYVIACDKNLHHTFLVFACSLFYKPSKMAKEHGL